MKLILGLAGRGNLYPLWNYHQGTLFSDDESSFVQVWLGAIQHQAITRDSADPDLYYHLATILVSLSNKPIWVSYFILLYSSHIIDLLGKNHVFLNVTKMWFKSVQWLDIPQLSHYLSQCWPRSMLSPATASQRAEIVCMCNYDISFPLGYCQVSKMVLEISSAACICMYRIKLIQLLLKVYLRPCLKALYLHRTLLKGSIFSALHDILSPAKNGIPGPVNGLAPPDNKPSPEPVLTQVTFTARPH